MNLELGLFTPGTICESKSGESLHPAELSAAVGRRSSQFYELGARPGHCIFIYQQNSLAFFINLLAAWRAELCAVPLGPGLPELLREQLVRRYGPALIVEAGNGVSMNANPRKWPEDTALILSSSGSTGPSKGILHTRGAITRKMETLARHIPLSHVERSLCALPTHFGHGLICNSLFPLLMGQKLIIAENFSPTVVAALDHCVETYGITFMSSTPVVWEFINQFASPKKKPTLTRVHCASAPMRPANVVQMREWAPTAEFFNVYGLTEMLGWISAQPVEAAQDDNLGLPWEAEATSVSGQIFLRAAYQAAGFIHSDDSVKAVASEDWINSGDLGEISPRGEIFLRGRSDFLINKGGLKIDPHAIEKICQEYPLFYDSVCFALTDALWGQRPALAIAGASKTFSIPQFREWLSQRVPSAQIPTDIFLLDHLPRNTRGKIDRTQLHTLIGIQ